MSDDKKDSIHWVLPKLQGAPPQGVCLNDYAPFVINKVVNKDCRRGRAYWKRKNENKIKEEIVDNPDPMEPPKKKRKPYRTIKSDCPAKMSIRTIKAYPDFAVAAETSKKIKGKFARMLKQAIINGEVEGEERYVVAISRAGHHQNHQNEMSEERVLPVHPDIVEYITKLVTQDDITSPKAIKSLVTQFSRENFRIGETSNGDRCFFPILKDIRTILRRIICNMQTSKFCQVTLEEDAKVLTHEREPEQKIFVSSETRRIIDDNVDNRADEKHFFGMSDGYLTLHFIQETSDEGNVATHIISAQDIKAELENVTEIQTLPDLSEDIDSVSTDRFKLLTALEQAVQQVTEVNNPQALKEALRCVEQASVVLESSLNKQ
ncbi:putative Amyotrophic lateral sclerosis 2 chromosomal region candidate 8-containing protein 2 [Homarus americanus]|uniref:Putative Amyotrophic lateral sclerosis 2 chromosomal region candidate 8-containing protein 2 n=1 Tax=Homarus americanus TaxID=6706 RepID=A0A8J5MXZ4_HOMAM|nr:putative Amyotrophic lateral sclerosis 2 chromosomal region candidate 8-containing protein 2 [Homarus americanus]